MWYLIIFTAGAVGGIQGREKSLRATREAWATYIGIVKVWPVWQRLQSLNPTSPPKDRLPLWQVEQFKPRALGKCCVPAGELTCRDWGSPAVML